MNKTVDRNQILCYNVSTVEKGGNTDAEKICISLLRRQRLHERAFGRKRREPCRDDRAWYAGTGRIYHYL